MRIQHNIMAMSAYRNYTNNVSAMRKNLEKLSSGYKINRAGDDAAGLAISEKMRAQITGLETAQKNAKDGISLVQTAEGALTEVHDMLNRMVELATMSANGTYDNTTDRAQLQKELDQLRSEIDRIADSANFNGIKLLDGSMDQGGRSVDADVTILPNDVILADNGFVGEGTLLKRTGNASQELSFGVQFDNLKVIAEAGDQLEITVGGQKFTLTFASKGTYDASKLATMLASVANGQTINGATFKASAAGTVVTFTRTDGATFDGNLNVTMTLKGTGSLIPLDDEYGIESHDGYQTYTTTTSVGGTLKSDVISLGTGGVTGAADTWTYTLTLSDADKLEAGNTIKVGNKQYTLKAEDVTNLQKAGSAGIKALAKILVDHAGTLGLEIASYGISLNAAGSAVVFTATKPGAIGSTGPATAATANAFTITVRKSSTEDQDPTGGAVTIGITGTRTVTGATEKPANKSVKLENASTQGIKSAIEGKLTANPQIKDGSKITVSLSSDGYAILKCEDVEIGRSTTKIGSAANGILDIVNGNDSLLKIRLVGSQASSLTAAVFGTQETGLTWSVTDNNNTGTPVTSDKIAGTVQANVFTSLDALATSAPTRQLGSGTGMTAADLTALKAITSFKIGNDEFTIDFSGKLANIATSSTIQAFLDAVKSAASAAIQAWNTANPNKGYHYEFDGISFTGDAGDIVTQANNPDGIYVHARKVTDPTPPGSGSGSVNNSYNSGTVNVVQAATAGGDQTASTVIDLKQIFGNDIGDGSSLTIGGTTFNFVWGDAYSDGGGGDGDGTYTITLDKNATGAERIMQAAAALTHYQTGAFSIGNRSTVNGNYGLISIDEKAGNTQYDTELRTHAGFESLFSAVSNLPKDETKGLTLQIGDTADAYNQLKVSIQDTHCTSLGISGIDISSQDKAAAAIDKIKAAINTVSDIRGTLGATQNRLDHTINNLSVMTENIQDAESTIRDVDIAEEMMAYTKNNILIQSAQAMLAQANQVPQGVLQLLQ